MTRSEQSRYSRQLILPEIGLGGQQRLRSASVLIVGMGGLGVPVAMYLAAAGIGRLRLVDDDRVDETNLHRQPLYATSDVGRFKVDVAAERLRAQNPHVTVEIVRERLSAVNALEHVRSADVVADGTDTFTTRYLVNDACVLADRPNAFASVNRFDGQASVFNGTLSDGTGGPCYRCLFPEPPPAGSVPSCAEGGVLGVLPGMLGLVQATEALKLVLGIGATLAGRLLRIDALGATFQTLRVARDPACPACGDAPTLCSLSDSAASCSVPPMSSVPEISVHQYQTLRDGGSPPFLLDVRQPEEYEQANLDGALIPLGELAERIDEIESHRDDEQIVVHCRSGARSAKAVEMLHAHGFTNAVNLQGGILGWAKEIDPSLPAT